MGAIYKISSIINNKIYIGSTVNFEKRKYNHIVDLTTNKHCNKILQNHFNKYGVNDFKIEVIETVENNERLIFREQHYIDTLKPHFNICKIAGSRLGTKHSLETIEKQKKSHSTISEETKSKMSNSRKGRIPWNKGQKGLKVAWNKGIPFSEETKKKMSISQTGKKQSIEQKMKSSISRKQYLQLLKDMP